MGRMKTGKTFGQSWWCPGYDLNIRPAKHEATAFQHVLLSHCVWIQSNSWYSCLEVWSLKFSRVTQIKKSNFNSQKTLRLYYRHHVNIFFWGGGGKGGEIIAVYLWNYARHLILQEMLRIVTTVLQSFKTCKKSLTVYDLLPKGRDCP